MSLTNLLHGSMFLRSCVDESDIASVRTSAITGCASDPERSSRVNYDEGLAKSWPLRRLPPVVRKESELTQSDHGLCAGSHLSSIFDRSKVNSAIAARCDPILPLGAIVTSIE